MEQAPLYDVADGPEGGAAYWLRAADGVRLRAGVWPASSPTDTPGPDGAKGTVFMLPGRTECVEKYGRSARDFADAGYASLAVDWRGQGLADRLIANRDIGHVEHFSDYALDLDAVIAMARQLALPKPWFVVGHSMGGAIALQSMLGDHPFVAASFSAPMWGIRMNPFQAALAKLVVPLFGAIGLLNTMAPGTKPKTYMLWQPFEDNKLTSDPDMYAYMRDQIVAHPELGLGGPSVRWFRESTKICAHFAKATLPDVPSLCFLGLDEKIVNTNAVRKLVDRWPSCHLIEVPGGRHEIMMETPAIRADFCARSVALFDAHR